MSELTAVGQITLVSVLDGEPGEPGAKGDPGQTGATGKGLDKIITMYYLSNSSEAPSGGRWSKERPKWRINTYLWTYQELHWINPKEVTETDPQLNREWSASREMVRGERNLALDSGKEITSEDSSDWLAFFELSEPLEGNTTYTLVTSVDLKNNDDNAKIYAYHNGGRTRIGTPMKDLGRGIYTLSIEMGDESDVSPQIGLKNEPIKTALSSTVHWFKIVKGEVTSYDWQPAPEDRKTELSQAVVDFDDKMGSLRSEVHSLNSQNEEKIVSMRQDISGIQMRVESKGALYKDLSDKLTPTMDTINIKSYRLNQPRHSSLDYELSFRLEGVQDANLDILYRWRDGDNRNRSETVYSKKFGIDSNHYHMASFVLPGLPGEKGVLDFNFQNNQNKDFTIIDLTIKEHYQRGVLDTVSSLAIEQGKITSQVAGVMGQMSSVVQESDRIYSIISNSEYSMINRTEDLRKSTPTSKSVIYSLRYGLKDISNQLLWRVTSPRPTSIALTVKSRNLIKKDNVDLIENKTYWNYYTTSELGMINRDDLLECNIRSLDGTNPGDIKVEFFEIPSITTVQSYAEQANDRISLMVSGKGEFNSLLKILENRIQLKASNIDLTGYVTLKDLDGSKGETIIDGGVIKTNSLRAEAINTGIISANTARGKNFWNLETGEFRNISSSGNSISMKDGMITSTKGNFKTEISGGTIKLYDPRTSGDHREVYEISYNTPTITPFQGRGGGVAYPSSQQGTSSFNLNATKDFSYVGETKNKIVSFVRKVNIPAFTGQGWTQWITLNFDGYGPDLTTISYAHASSLSAKELIFNIRQVYSYAWAITGLQVQGALMTPEKGWPGGEVLIAVLMIGRH